MRSQRYGIPLFHAGSPGNLNLLAPLARRSGTKRIELADADDIYMYPFRQHLYPVFLLHSYKEPSGTVVGVNLDISQPLSIRKG